MEMNKDQKELLGSLREKENSSKEISQKELDEITKKMSDLEQRKIQKKQQFFEDLDNLLTTDQRARYLGFELRFMEDLRKGMRDRMGRIDRLKGPSGKKRYMKKMNGKMRKDGWR
jgi:CRISPR/Cas system CMR subunit Cmr6 (Cas7 group RAMP superfamily)